MPRITKEKPTSRSGVISNFNENCSVKIIYDLRISIICIILLFKILSRAWILLVLQWCLFIFSRQTIFCLEIVE